MQNEQTAPARAGQVEPTVRPLVERLRMRTLVQHGGPRGMDYGWNLQEHDSELHREAADEIERLERLVAAMEDRMGYEDVMAVTRRPNTEFSRARRASAGTPG